MCTMHKQLNLVCAKCPQSVTKDKRKRAHEDNDKHTHERMDRPTKRPLFTSTTDHGLRRVTAKTLSILRSQYLGFALAARRCEEKWNAKEPTAGRETETAGRLSPPTPPLKQLLSTHSVSHPTVGIDAAIYCCSGDLCAEVNVFPVSLSLSPPLHHGPARREMVSIIFICWSVDRTWKLSGHYTAAARESRLCTDPIGGGSRFYSKRDLPGLERAAVRSRW